MKIKSTLCTPAELSRTAYNGVMSIKVLVVEDERDLADFVTRGLREEGYVVETAADGTSGWHCLKHQHWDAVILDWGLPGIDGLTLLTQFREKDKTTPVLFLTARDAVPDRVCGLDRGADDYLCKPFAFDELLARIRALVRRPNQAAARTIEQFGVTVDLETHRAERHGAKLELTAKELALLVFFMRRPRQVLTRTRIYEQVWDERYDGLSNTLEVHVKELRRKLEAHGPRLIHTLRGQGYRFDSASELEDGR
jgi:two-component system copper resistance phosphate regulon response regulator CusR